MKTDIIINGSITCINDFCLSSGFFILGTIAFVIFLTSIIMRILFVIMNSNNTNEGIR